MPHDKNGNLLREGDEVVLRCKVTTVQSHLEYCNLNLSTIEPMFPGTTPTTIVVNAKQVELVRGVDEGQANNAT